MKEQREQEKQRLKEDYNDRLQKELEELRLTCVGNFEKSKEEIELCCIEKLEKLQSEIANERAGTIELVEESEDLRRKNQELEKKISVLEQELKF